MSAVSSLLAAVMQLPESDRFAIAMAILDDSSPAACTEDEISTEAAQRQDEIENGLVETLSYDELIRGLSYQPRSLAK